MTLLEIREGGQIECGHWNYPQGEASRGDVSFWDSGTCCDSLGVNRWEMKRTHFWILVKWDLFCGMMALRITSPKWGGVAWESPELRGETSGAGPVPWASAWGRWRVPGLSPAWGVCLRPPSAPSLPPGAALSCSFGPFPPHPSPVTSPALLASFPLGPQRLSPVGPPPALLDDLESGRF